MYVRDSMLILEVDKCSLQSILNSSQRTKKVNSSAAQAVLQGYIMLVDLGPRAFRPTGQIQRDCDSALFV